MKKNHLKLLIPLVLFIFASIGCLKDMEFRLAYIKNHPTWGRNECRLDFGTNADPTGSADFTFHYNDKGLADVWDIQNYGTYTLEYDAFGRIQKATLTQGGAVTGTTAFFYDGGIRVAREVLYNGTGKDTTDVEYYNYDLQGNLVKVQSFLNDYIATGKYDSDGNLLESDLYFSGIPAYTALYTYDKQYKNPYLAVPGIDHLFPYYTPMDLFYGKLRWASLKQLAYDDAGKPIVTFEYDPSKTVWQAGSHSYPASATYFDILSSGSYPYPFEYDNCDGIHNNNGKLQVAAPSVESHAGKINVMKLLMRNPAKSLKNQIQELRLQLKNIKN